MQKLCKQIFFLEQTIPGIDFFYTNRHRTDRLFYMKFSKTSHYKLCYTKTKTSCC